LNNWPQEIRKVDIPGLIGALQEVTGPLGPGAQPITADGLETFLTFLERFVPLLEKSSQAIMNMRAFEARSQPQDTVEADPGADDDGWYGGDVYVDDDAPQRSPRREPRAQPSQPREPHPGVDEAMPQKVYATIMETLAQLPEEMTIAQALGMAREKKALIVQNIAAELGKL